MKVESRIFLGIMMFFIVMTGVYGLWTHFNSQLGNSANKGTEWAGAAALLLSAGLTGIAGSFLWFVSRRIDPRPEDRFDAEIAEGAGELGFFSPGSYWPIAIAGAGTVTGVGAAFGQLWLMFVGVALILFTVSGLLFEYYMGGSRPLR